MLSLDGRTLMQLPAAGADVLELDVKALPAGVYIVTLTTDLGPISGRLVVK